MTRLSVALLAAALMGCGGASETTADAPTDRNEAAVAVAEAAPEAKPAEKAEAAVAEAAPAETTQPSAEGWIDYGTGMSGASAVAASAVMGAPADYLGKTVKVEGEVAEVCKSMGCWLSFQHEGQELVVNMKDHGFSVDKSGAGSWCEAEGEVVKQGEMYSITAHAVRMKKSAEAKEAPAEPAKDAAPESNEG